MDCSFLSLEGKVALVTGGSRGIGKAIALLFATAGAHVAVASRKIAGVQAVADEITTMGRQSLAVAAHARKPDELTQLVRTVMERFGRIDILVNNAATNPGMGPLVDTDTTLFDQIMETNLRGYFVVSREVGRIMREQADGVIINISSAGGVSPAENLGPYCISKAAINMLTKAMALELGPHNVRVNAIAPRFVKTGFSQALWSDERLMEKEYAQVPLKRIGTTDEIARSALFLASSAANYMTGQVVVINGGAFL
ncbi:MAG: glucose 1-dehydrogenase [Desulfobacterales bacterium]|nr:glucose 1-dehydrogenase [Desulfobacterales bacterium]